MLLEQIYQLARDRTANSQTVTIGGTLRSTDQKNRNAKILCVSGVIGSDDIDIIYAAGVDLHLVKPVSASSFVAGLCQLIENGCSNNNKPFIDLGKMNERFGGMQELTVKTIENFIGKYGDAPRYLSNLLSHDSIDYDTLYLYIHNLANNVDLLFASRISEILRNLEPLIGNKNINEMSEIIASKKLYSLLGELIEEARLKVIGKF